jgi:acyl-coenzyme A synthetase/AMP-(fatty) acid ligase
MFYADLHESCSYSSLISKINSTDKVISNLYRFTILDFYVNLLSGLAASVDIVLLDNDFSSEEIEMLTGSKYEEKTSSILSLKIDNLDDLICRVRSSSSKLTMFTSGTTGVPKMIEHSVESLTRNIKSDNRFNENVWGFAYNPTHMAGLQVFFQALFNKNTIVNIFGLNKQDIFDSIEKFSISHISATPTFFRLLVPSVRVFHTVKQLTFGGEKSEKALHLKVLEIFPEAKIRNVYASTEAGALFASTGDGFIIPEGIKENVKIENGELYIHRSLLGKSNSFNDDMPWYASGDMVEFLDNDKQIFRILSRRSEMINVGGYKINPNEVESAIRNMEGIKESRVYGIPNSVLGNILCADVVTYNKTLSETDIKKFLAMCLQSFKVPRKIFFKEEITISRTGKIERKNAKR